MAIKSISILILATIAKNYVLSAPVTDSVHETIKTHTVQPTDKNYPLTPPVTQDDGTINYRIAIICDLDSVSKSSVEKNTWISYLKKGYLRYNSTTLTVTIDWDKEEDTVLKSNNSVNNRGMELSELVTYDGKLLTVDDKTGIVYIIENQNSLKEWVVLKESDENGISSKGFKGEWATVVGEKLYVGSHGTEYFSSEDEVSNVNMWVKVINKDGVIEHVDWTNMYKKLREKLHIDSSGYIIHEACEWSDKHQKYFFLPRKLCKEKFDPQSDEGKATNVLLSATKNFESIEVVEVGDVKPFHGYASFKFIPETNDSIIVAIKSKEQSNCTATYITVFDINGNVLLDETFVSKYKFEGFDFI
ncbi:soluble calcium-activated nucleotidase 1-like [Daktulosphaira vitifoliae]|uniref:soluble calcium-activated nucleotidase 1-like n=1 Tax=Daktulosphaira vitifoliae TaxID=58002 RepID=UPI0021A9B405|nr:soluble calcium-activated nucleotidase 1-like [Daktulosphaira vitifoliae]XP_050549056.1 soluble calcium-activated nucleotidase 1-like [Daktulosphaira vitifoliae]XP_050549057.1 soluble calcium-activated nucleotidase 1-like [Daktulosphaira vitifoliae]XP_050549058.1 soluble calcium-activated nucleotidase 1-like [Daktulosphaira vitifoliae]XP_050549059.1 soluble calcium-activated nucleotidase 1-like [Daktulosphaira vitifoliae]XP_050549060.1 soluble calcium-activated nucleotidase 1-like [Daktulos